MSSGCERGRESATHGTGISSWELKLRYGPVGWCLDPARMQRAYDSTRASNVRSYRQRPMAKVVGFRVSVAAGCYCQHPLRGYLAGEFGRDISEASVCVL